ncbi:MAG: AAA family ATPase [Methyloceanibacter sp.]|nr:AAA family ATPase [Methyloceanibacter sp.]
MQISRLRLLGFKSFVEPTELSIEQGLTGVVGPNGCGKSNLLEALRWAMGETSYKSMRGSAMDDVIFAGAQDRPARNTAEVTLFIDNSERLAPAEFNDADVLEITRRIEREAGSAYRVNGKDVRARDVRLLFEDAATGARSPALVQQGRIGEIVSATPLERRRVLEDAAGVAGLHSRRHEAELRLRAAENNLARLADLIGQLTSQLQATRRQARQAKRYRNVSTKIQEVEALSYHLQWVAACAQVEADEAAFQDSLAAVAEETRAESEALRNQEAAADRLQPLRDEEAARAAVLHRLSVDRDALEREEERAKARQEELETQLAQAARDLTREEDQIAEANKVLQGLAEEKAGLEAISTNDSAEPQLREAAAGAAAVLAETETALRLATTDLAEARAERGRLESEQVRLSSQIGQFETQTEDLAQQLANLEAESGGETKLTELNAEAEKAAALLEDAALALTEAEAEEEHARAEETRLRGALADAKVARQEIETELATLLKLLAPPNEWTPIVDDVRIEGGYEHALGAALGDDLDAAAEDSAPAHWRMIGGSGDDPALPEGATPLSRFVTGPAAIARRLSQIGVVDAEQGTALQAALRPGQRLVSKDGDLWRWDGYSVQAGAATAQGARLEERTRLESLKTLKADAETAETAAETALQAATKASQTASQKTKDLRHKIREDRAELDRTRSEIASVEREVQANSKQLGALSEALSRTKSARDEAQEQSEAASSALRELTALDGLTAALEAAQGKTADARSEAAQAEANLKSFENEVRLRTERITAITAEEDLWRKRIANANTQIETLSARKSETATDLEALALLPAQIEERRGKLMNSIADAERDRSKAADALAEAETTLREHDKALRATQESLASAREAKAGSEARLEGARERRSGLSRLIREQIDCTPEECLQRANLAEGAELPSLEEVEPKLAKLKADRERLGGVNLRAEEEEIELAAQLEDMEREKGDVEEAIAQLRQGISSLNREGRKRLLEAFDMVNAHFTRLFQTLFGGGTAELRLVDSDDPLESGLEIFAQPPGKKTQTLSLMSGGEKALTALALIFAVFLTNPSPICVLDEVDAPLDDANVDRFCRLMDEMAKETSTRFLIITHHPLTMARVSRLFGVTMQERGVSQLVSVDLETAEQLRDAS